MTTWPRMICETGGLLSPLECRELAWFARQADPNGNALEIGHYTGLSTCVLLDSLPVSMDFCTIDSHEWRSVSVGAFADTVKPFLGERKVAKSITGDWKTSTLTGPFSFVFYDAAHTSDECAQFWITIAPLLSDGAMLLYDDADWAGMDVLGECALANGFEDITIRPFHRHVIPYTTGIEQIDLDLGKRHPDTYTLRVLRRTQ